jgi:hypothetical protein
LEYAVADSIKTTSGIIAIVFLVALGIFIVLLDVFDLGTGLCFKQGNKQGTTMKQNKKNEKKEKPIYLSNGGTK